MFGYYVSKFDTTYSIKKRDFQNASFFVKSILPICIEVAQIWHPRWSRLHEQAQEQCDATVSTCRLFAHLMVSVTYQAARAGCKAILEL